MGIVVPLLLASFTFLLYISWRSSRSVRLPPGPARLPIIGSLHHIPFGRQQLAFLAWKKTYGDIVYLQLFHKPAVVLNSVKAADELLDKRGSKYSDRPTSVLIGDLIGFTNNVTILPYGDQWRRQRRWFQNGFQSAAALTQYEPLQQYESVRMLAGMIDLCTSELSPHDMGAKVFSGIKRYVGAMMMDIAYGHSVASLDDEFVVLSERAISGTVALGTSVASLVDFFPALRHVPAWVPGMGFMRRIAEVRELVRAMIDVPYGRVRASLARGAARPCFLTALLDEHAKDGQVSAADEADVKGAANIVYGAGTDTTATVLTSFLLAAVLHPESLQKAQAELDSVITSGRLPDFEDRRALVYCEALLMEVYRWNPPVPLVIPHLVSEDDVYEGYTIPSGSVIMPNIWAMARDPECYADPWTFNPERFLGSSAERDPRELAFGFGRRACPGRAFGDASVWLAAVRMIAVFEFAKAREPSTGAIVEFEPEFASGMISHVKEFPMSVRVRSEAVARLVRELDAGGGGET